MSRGLKVPATIGPLGSDVDFIQPFFRDRLSGSEFRVTPLLPFRYRISQLSKLLKHRQAHGVTHYFAYDGGLSELLIVNWLATLHPSIGFTFNFHWADQWMSLATARGPLPSLTRRLVRRLIHDSPENLRFSGETTPFSTELTKVFDHDFYVFPIFCSSAPDTSPDWKDRSVDVLFLPQRRSEMDFVARAASALGKRGLSVSVALKPDTWERWGNRVSLGLLEPPLFLPLAAKDYEILLTSSRIVVLPYDKPYFRWGSSGKFNEAIAHGCFPLAPRGTAIPSQSSGKPENHEFRYPDESHLVDVVSRVLKNPAESSSLKPVLIADFFRWIAEDDMKKPCHSNQGISFSSLALLLAASFYREQAIPTRVRFILSSTIRETMARVRNDFARAPDQQPKRKRRWAHPNRGENG